jgi:hypothetical protein
MVDQIGARSNGREVNLERGASAEFSFKRDAAPARVRDTQHGGEPQPGPAFGTIAGGNDRSPRVNPPDEYGGSEMTASTLASGIDWSTASASPW